MTFILQDGCSPLNAASCYGHLAAVKTLLEAGANINQADKVVRHVFSAQWFRSLDHKGIFNIIQFKHTKVQSPTAIVN